MISATETFVIKSTPPNYHAPKGISFQQEFCTVNFPILLFLIFPTPSSCSKS